MSGMEKVCIVTVEWWDGGMVEWNADGWGRSRPAFEDLPIHENQDINQDN